jgi:Protein of unknown function (DUF3175)
MTERKQNPRKWSAAVTRHSDALDLESDNFESDNPVEVAQSLQRSAERSNRRKSVPFRSAMSILTFYINRAGKNLSADRRKKGATPGLWAKSRVTRAMFVTAEIRWFYQDECPANLHR